MSYAIDERNPERQQLLARILEPFTENVLARLPSMAAPRCLDLGCGHGNATRLLSKMLGASECVGLEYDQALVEYASARPNNPQGVSFQQGDVTRLPFPDASFDVVFCRYLLVHLSDPAAGMREMMRVVRPGGHVVAYEPDLIMEFSDPESQALALINRVWNGLFPQPNIGRTLVRAFRQAGASRVEGGAMLHLEHDAAVLKRTYRLSAEATGPLAQAKGILNELEVRQMIEGLARLEEDPTSTLVKFPDMWVIAQR